MSVRQLCSPVMLARISPAERLDRVGQRARPAALAQVEQRLARAVARQLGLGAVGVEDPQARDVAGLVGRGEREHAVGADAAVAVAQRAHALGLEPVRLHDQVVVAERLPFLEPHARRIMPCSSSATSSGLAAGDVDRVHAGQLAHPRQLALGVSAGAGLHRVDVARQQLLEAERLARGRRGAQRGRRAGPRRARPPRPSRRRGGRCARRARRGPSRGRPAASGGACRWSTAASRRRARAAARRRRRAARARARSGGRRSARRRRRPRARARPAGRAARRGRARSARRASARARPAAGGGRRSRSASAARR